MNEKKSLYLCLDLWLWLKDNPLCNKSDYPEYKIKHINEMSDSCPLCEYYGVCSKGCPLSGKRKNCVNYYAWMKSSDIKERIKSCESIIKKVKSKIKSLDK